MSVMNSVLKRCSVRLYLIVFCFGFLRLCCQLLWIVPLFDWPSGIILRLFIYVSDSLKNSKNKILTYTYTTLSEQFQT